MAVVNTPPSVVPVETDILCGRGKTCFEHEGNRRFRLIVANNVSAYIAAETRRKKTVVVRAIINEVLEAGGRFLKKTPNGNWYDAGLKGAKEKVGHSLRDASTDRVKCMTKMRKKMLQTQERQQQQARSVSLDLDTLGCDTSETMPNNNNNSTSKRSVEDQLDSMMALVPNQGCSLQSTMKLCDRLREVERSRTVVDTIATRIAADWDDCLSPGAVDTLMSAFDSTAQPQDSTSVKHKRVPSSITVPACLNSPSPHGSVADQELFQSFHQESQVLTGVDPFDENDFNMIEQPGVVSLSEDDDARSLSIDDDVLSFSCDITESSLSLLPDCQSLHSIEDGQGEATALGLRRNHSFISLRDDCLQEPWCSEVTMTTLLRTIPDIL